MVHEELADVLELRPGRWIFCRHWIIGSSSNGDGGTSTTTIHLICIHGTAASQDQYLPLLRAIDKRLETSNVIVSAWLYDAVGCGKSPKPKSLPPLSSPPSTSSSSRDEGKLYADKEQVLDLDEFLRKLVWKKASPTCRVFFMAHSYGPNWVYKWMIQEQQRLHSNYNRNALAPSFLSQVTGLVLISTGTADTKLLVKGGPPLFRCCPLCVLRCLQPMLTSMFLKLGLAPATHKAQPDLIQAAKEANNRNDMETVCYYYQSHDWLSAQDLFRFCHEVLSNNNTSSTGTNSSSSAIKVLVVHGVEDGIIPIQHGQIVANAMMGQGGSHVSHHQGGLVSIADAGHVPMQEQPEVMADHLVNFLLTTNHQDGE